MCIPQKIPLPITVLYIIAVVNLTILLNLTLVEANVLVLTKTNNTIEDGIMDLPAQFGPSIPNIGVWGHLMYVTPADACGPVNPPPTDTHNETGIGNKWIALIRRNGCNFDIKVLNVQKQGYVAAIVHNVDSDKLVAMGGSGNGSQVKIPAVFIAFSNADYLKVNYDKNVHYTIVIDKQTPFIDPGMARMIFAIFGIVIGSCFITMIIFAIVKWVRDIRRRRRSRLSKVNLNKLPVKKFKKGDIYDVCAICLDEYEEGNKLRILPCNHAYHQKCIDPWLTKNKKTCPICKRKVIPGHTSSDSSSSESDSDSGGATTTGYEVSGESEPLLGSTSTVRSTGNTFTNSGLPERFRADGGLNAHATDSSSNADSSDDGLVPVTRYQSSVEVHSEPDYRRNNRIRPPKRGRPNIKYNMVDERPQSCSAVEQTVNENKEPDMRPVKPSTERAWEYGISPRSDQLEGAVGGIGAEEDAVIPGVSAQLEDHIESHLDNERPPPQSDDRASILDTLFSRPEEGSKSMEKKKTSGKASGSRPQSRSGSSGSEKSKSGGNMINGGNDDVADSGGNDSDSVSRAKQAHPMQDGRHSHDDDAIKIQDVRLSSDAIEDGDPSDGVDGNSTEQLSQEECAGAVGGTACGAEGGVDNAESSEQPGGSGGSDTAPLIEQPDVEIVHSSKRNNRRKTKRRRKNDA